MTQYRVGILGRTEILLDGARKIVEAGHKLPIIITRKEEDYYQASQEDYKTFSDEIGAEFIPDAKIRDNNTISRIRAADCDIIFSLNWPILIQKYLLGIPKYGIFNIHPGDLPRYRGNACFNWAILNGERQVGICVHLMTEKLDEGPVIERTLIDIDDSVTVTQLFSHWRKVTPEMLLATLAKLADIPNCLETQSAMEQDILRTYPRRPSDNRIDWTEPAELIDRLVRASTRPFVGAFTLFENEKRMTIWKSKIYPHYGAYHAVPGQLIHLEDNGVGVATGSGVLALKEILLEGFSDHQKSTEFLSSSMRNRLY